MIAERQQSNSRGIPLTDDGSAASRPPRLSRAGDTVVAAYHAVTGYMDSPAKKLLRADNFHGIAAILRVRFLIPREPQRFTDIVDRIEADLYALREVGHRIDASAAELLTQWVSTGFLSRRPTSDGGDDEYALTSDTIRVLNFVNGAGTEVFAASESTMALVANGLRDAAMKADPSPDARIAYLDEQILELQRQRNDLLAGRMEPVVPGQVRAEIRSLLAVAEDIPVSVVRYGEGVRALARNLHREALEERKEFSAPLRALFDGEDALLMSEEGRTFQTFMNYLIDPRQNSTLNESITQLLERAEELSLTVDDQRRLGSFLNDVKERAWDVQRAQTQMNKTLGGFVASADFAQQRRLHSLLKALHRSALDMLEDTPIHRVPSFELEGTRPHFTSIGRWTFPAERRSSPPPVRRLDPVADAVLQDLRNGEHTDVSAIHQEMNEILRTRGGTASLPDIIASMRTTPRVGDVVVMYDFVSRHGALEQDQPRELIQVRVAGRTRPMLIPSAFFIDELPPLAGGTAPVPVPRIPLPLALFGED